MSLALHSVPGSAAALAVLPHWQVNSFRLGPVELQTFGSSLAAALVTGYLVIRWRAGRLGLDTSRFRRMFYLHTAVAFFCAHLTYLLLYHPQLWRGPISLFLPQGIASYGGLAGGTLFFLLYTRWRRLDTLLWGDAVVTGIAAGFIPGRLGCALVHDHLGVAAGDFFLAVDIDGVPHHDLGLYELLVWALLIVPVLLLLGRRPVRPGTIPAVATLLYSSARFSLDFLRTEVGDPRYLGLTPAQYLALLTFAGGLWLVRLSRRRAPVAPARPGAAIAPPPG
jgi:phosphatidylglycerol:prolipoprotein diacylglycerol transferase